MDTSGFVKVPWMDCCVVGTNVVLTLVVPKILSPWVVIYVKYTLFHHVCNQKNLISIGQDCWCLMVLFAMPTAVKLS
jgi:hypothetical protein